MIYSQSAKYAIRALVYLGKVPQGKYYTAKKIGSHEDIPEQFLGKICQELSRHNLLKSRRGRGGGFQLNKRPSEITLLEVVEVVDGPDPLGQCMFGFGQCDSENPCPLHERWEPIRRRIRQFLKENTIHDLL